MTSCAIRRSCATLSAGKRTVTSLSSADWWRPQKDSPATPWCGNTSRPGKRTQTYWPSQRQSSRAYWSAMGRQPMEVIRRSCRYVARAVDVSPGGRHTAWIRDLILSAVPTSLNLVNDLYSWWTGDRGVVTATERTRIRADVVKEFREVVRTGGDLARVLTPQHPYSIFLLITQAGVETDISAYRAWQDYLPSVLIDGARQKPEIVVPDLANLVGDEQSGHRAIGPMYPPVFLRRYKIDRERMTTLFGERIEELLLVLAEYDGTNPYASRAKEDARAWLSERTKVTLDVNAL